MGFERAAPTSPSPGQSVTHFALADTEPFADTLGNCGFDRVRLPGAGYAFDIAAIERVEDRSDSREKLVLFEYSLEFCATGVNAIEADLGVDFE